MQVTIEVVTVRLVATVRPVVPPGKMRAVQHREYRELVTICSAAPAAIPTTVKGSVLVLERDSLRDPGDQMATGP